jgi:hypothetical protein
MSVQAELPGRPMTTQQEGTRRSGPQSASGVAEMVLPALLVVESSAAVKFIVAVAYLLL